MEQTRKIGIMGGTFNPIHNGHVALADAAYKTFSLDKVLFMPSGNSYMKQHVLDNSKRVSMVSKAIESISYFELSTIEVERFGNTYTSETLQQLTQQNPDVQYYFIMGADSLFHIEKWKDPEIIFQLSTLICMVRDDYNMADIKKKGAELAQRGADILYLNMPKIDISSTDIRNRVKLHQSISELVPEKVEKYILQEHLYEKEY
ncbi:MAG: nicotinate-nucleotide adenylyltransferase [Lachnospiraceae bacterium]|nr:nicotinate-nucleotide adenylyltransferase [Lachnospiraceae bacterium]